MSPNRKLLFDVSSRRAVRRHHRGEMLNPRHLSRLRSSRPTTRMLRRFPTRRHGSTQESAFRHPGRFHPSPLQANRFPLLPAHRCRTRARGFLHPRAPAVAGTRHLQVLPQPGRVDRLPREGDHQWVVDPGSLFLVPVQSPVAVQVDAPVAVQVGVGHRAERAVGVAAVKNSSRWMCPATRQTIRRFPRARSWLSAPAPLRSWAPS